MLNCEASGMAYFLLSSNETRGHLRKTECGAKQLLTASAVRAAPFALAKNPTAEIGSPHEPLLKRASAVPRPQSGRPRGACCNGSVWDTPAPPNCAGTDRSRPERSLPQPEWKRL